MAQVSQNLPSLSARMAPSAVPDGATEDAAPLLPLWIQENLARDRKAFVIATQDCDIDSWRVTMFAEKDDCRRTTVTKLEDSEGSHEENIARDGMAFVVPRITAEDCDIDSWGATLLAEDDCRSTAATKMDFLEGSDEEKLSQCRAAFVVSRAAEGDFEGWDAALPTKDDCLNPPAFEPDFLDRVDYGSEWQCNRKWRAPRARLSALKAGRLEQRQAFQIARDDEMEIKMEF